jgi:hypothetical protein
MVRVMQNPQPYFTASSETPSNLEGQVPLFISLRNRMVQLYHWELGFFYITSYDSEGYCEGILARVHTGLTLRNGSWS